MDQAVLEVLGMDTVGLMTKLTSVPLQKMSVSVFREIHVLEGMFQMMEQVS